jgi:hypothetical protein
MNEFNPPHRMLHGKERCHAELVSASKMVLNETPKSAAGGFGVTKPFICNILRSGLSTIN